MEQEDLKDVDTKEKQKTFLVFVELIRLVIGKFFSRYDTSTGEKIERDIKKDGFAISDAKIASTDEATHKTVEKYDVMEAYIDVVYRFNGDRYNEVSRYDILLVGDIDKATQFFAMLEKATRKMGATVDNAVKQAKELLQCTQGAEADGERTDEKRDAEN